jgi:hypothetical protein
MMLTLLTVNPTLAAWGQIAAIIICFSLFLFVLVTLVFQVFMAIASDWIAKKSELIKTIRPQVNSINATVTKATQGEPVSPDANPILRTVATIPATINTVDQRVERTTTQVSNAAIEFHARTQQAKTVLKAFFLPGLMRPAAKKDLEFQSPGYRAFLERQAAEIPHVGETAEAEAEIRAAEKLRPIEAAPEPAIPPEPVGPTAPADLEEIPAQTVTRRPRQRNHAANR